MISTTRTCPRAIRCAGTCCTASDCYNRNHDEVQHSSPSRGLRLRPEAADYAGDSQRGRARRRRTRRRRAAHLDAGRQDLRLPPGAQPHALRSRHPNFQAADRHHADRRRRHECAARRRSHRLDQSPRARRRHADLWRWQVDALQRRRRPVPDPHRHRQVGPTHQNAGGGIGCQALARRPYGRLPPRLGPLYRGRGLRQGDAPHPRRDPHTAQQQARPSVASSPPHSATLRNGVPDWVYPEERYLGTGFWWSPDSKSLCYLQFDSSREPVFPHADMLGTRAFSEPERYPQAGENNPDVHLGVIASTGGPTKWLEVGDTRNAYLIARAGWMPNARSVYILRMNRVQNKLEMLSIDAESGAATTVFQESDPHWINLEGDIEFLKDGKRFLWTSQRDGGFRHIFLYSNDGKSVKQLTKGNWEVAAINAVDEAEAGGRIYYTSSEPTPTERHLYTMKLDGTGKRQLTAANYTHSVSMSPAGAFYLVTYSNLATPGRTTLHSGDGQELGVYRESDRAQADQYDIRPTAIVKFKGPDGSEFYGRLIKPAGFEPGKKYPVIVDVYGGPGVGSPIRNAWSGVGIDQVYAHKGYVVWQCENRGIMGRGHAFETAIYHKLGVTELADQVAGVKYLISLGFADPARIGITGTSYGD